MALVVRDPNLLEHLDLEWHQFRPEMACILKYPAVMPTGVKMFIRIDFIWPPLMGHFHLGPINYDGH